MKISCYTIFSSISSVDVLDFIEILKILGASYKSGAWQAVCDISRVGSAM